MGINQQFEKTVLVSNLKVINQTKSKVQVESRKILEFLLLSDIYLSKVQTISYCAFINWRVQSSAKKRFTVKTESITEEGSQYLQLSRESLIPRDR